MTWIDISLEKSRLNEKLVRSSIAKTGGAAPLGPWKVCGSIAE